MTLTEFLKQVYNEKLMNTLLSKRSLKNLILDTCQKTASIINCMSK